MKELAVLTKKHFPSNKFKTGQLYAIVHALNAIINENKRNVVIQAPTGTGKTFIGITIDRVLRELTLTGKFNSPYIAHNETFESLFVTSTITLQEQYKSEFKNLVNIKSKKNYQCKFGTTYKDKDCIKTVMNKECSFTSCPYFIERLKFTGCKTHKLTNTAFLLTAPIELLSSKTIKDDETDEINTFPLDLLVIDEAHELPEIIINQCSFTFPETEMIDKLKRNKENATTFKEIINALKNLMTEIRISQLHTGYISHVGQFASLFKHLQDLMNDLQFRIDRINDHIKQDDDNSKIDVDFYATGNEFLEIYSKLKIFINRCNETCKWVYTEQQTPIGYGKTKKVYVTHSIKPLYAFGELSNQSFHAKSIYKVFMSATIPNNDVFCDEMGLNTQDTLYLHLPSNIPINRRPISVVSNGIYIKKGYDIHKQVELIDKIIAKHTNPDSYTSDNCAIHTSSYQMAKDIVEHSQYKERMVILESQEQKDLMLERMKTQKGVIIISPSITTGVNLLYDIARYQIITKVPYLNLGDNYVSAKAKDNPKWYNVCASLAIIQATGRICRTDNDYGKTYIIDSNFKRLMSGNPDLFPDWYKHAIITEFV